jgi:hypothetical protein
MDDRQIHMSLLDQVADSTHERNEVRRILGGLTERELDAHNTEHWAAVNATVANKQYRSWPAMPRKRAPVGPWVALGVVGWLVFCGIAMPMAVHFFFK